MPGVENSIVATATSAIIDRPADLVLKMLKTPHPLTLGLKSVPPRRRQRTPRKIPSHGKTGHIATALTRRRSPSSTRAKQVNVGRSNRYTGQRSGLVGSYRGITSGWFPPAPQ